MTIGSQTQMTIQTSSSQVSSAAAGGRVPSSHAEQRQQHVVVMLQMLTAMLQCLRPLLLLPRWLGGWRHCQVGQALLTAVDLGCC
jgi:hypothetical protein